MRTPGATWLLWLAALGGCDVVLCNPEYTCEGTVVVRCDVKCTGGGGKLDPPRECKRLETRTDCAAESPALGVARTCRVIKNVGLCLDAPVTPCTGSSESSCTATGALTSCVTFYEQQNRFRSTRACLNQQTCHPMAQGAGCVDSPRTSCDPDAGFPRCTAERTLLTCVGTSDAGYVTATLSTGLCADAGP